MLGLFRRLFFDDIAASEPESDERLVRAVTQGLDLRAAIAAHELWKVRLERYLLGRSGEDLRPEVICFDDRCALGQWIYSAGQPSLGHLPEFRKLVADHKTFHHAASNVVALTQAGRKDDAERMLKGAYKGASKGVLDALSEIQALVEAGAAPAHPTRAR